MTDAPTPNVRRPSAPRAGQAFWWVLAAGLLLVLGANLPGHLSYDSVAALREGRFAVRETWGPILYARILGGFDALLPGAALYVCASAVLFFGSLAALPKLRRRTSWLAAPVAAGLIVLPHVLIYQGIVWKDVLFANCAVAAFVLIALAAQRWPRRAVRWTLVLVALTLLAVGGQVRQNGAIAGLFAALSLGWIAASAGPRLRILHGAVYAIAALLFVVVAGGVMSRLAMPTDAPDEGLSTGLHIVQGYDLVGAMALDPSYPMPLMAKAAPQAEAVLRAAAPRVYSGQRVDFITQDPPIRDAFDDVDGKVYEAEWARLITQRPDLYLRVRWEDFRWIAGTPVIDRCLPIYVGVDAPGRLLESLDMKPRRTRADNELQNWTTWFLDTPAYSHLTYLAVSLVLAGLFLWRRDGADVTLAALQLGGVAFAASFFVVGLACDYRYLYFSDLAAIAGLIYAAIDPDFRRRHAV